MTTTSFIKLCGGNTLLGILMFFASLSLFAAEVQPARQASESPVVAAVDDVKITADTLDERVGDRLLAALTQAYTIKQQILEQYIDELLLKREANRRQVSVAQLIRSEIDERIKPVTESDAIAVIESRNPPAFSPSRAEEQAAMADLKARRTARRRTEFSQEQREAYHFRNLLPAPRSRGAVRSHYSRGPEGAPISLVVFSDYQCRYCLALHKTIQQLAEEFPNDIRVTAKQFPLPSHPRAQGAAEAALCAGEQGRFWQMDDALYDEAALVENGEVAKIAQRVGLDTGRFTACLQSGRSAAELRTDKAEASALGISATPTMLLNGQLISGTRPYDALKGIIMTEIERLSVIYNPAYNAPVGNAPAKP